tara:strand:- start:897 stop:1052 length:156 start_codon:yes stop_codon:yes gene_type:complete
MFKMTTDQRKQLLQYFWKIPYGESAALVNMLAALPEIQEEKKDDKNKKDLS